MPKLISIQGPTATGKTALAQSVRNDLFAHASPPRLRSDVRSQSFAQIELISADSRQVYKGMEIGTGVDATGVLGTSMRFPNEPWSVSEFQTWTQEQLEKIWAANGIPILVGGTGLYHHQLFQTDPKLHVPPNENVRAQAAELTLEELQQWVQQVAPAAWARANNSDRNNPRRLVRMIEIELSIRAAKTTLRAHASPPRLRSDVRLQGFLQPRIVDTFSLVLFAPLDYLIEKITARVQARWQHGMREEVQTLMQKYDDETWQNSPAFSATGYKEVRAFLEDQLSEIEMLELWTRREIQYAKRQLTWLKKYAQPAEGASPTLWFDVTQANWQTPTLAKIQDFLLGEPAQAS